MRLIRGMHQSCSPAFLAVRLLIKLVVIGPVVEKATWSPIGGRPFPPIHLTTQQFSIALCVYQSEGVRLRQTTEKSLIAQMRFSSTAFWLRMPNGCRALSGESGKVQGSAFAEGW